MKFLLCLLFSAVFLLGGANSALAQSALAQVDSAVGQITSSNTADIYVRGISGDGRFVVFESTGDLATERTADALDTSGNVVQYGLNNADANLEIFLYDYAQRRIFQITNTKRALVDPTGSTTSSANIDVDVVNTRPVISNDGRFIAFVSNAYSTVAGNTNPGFFNGNLTQTVSGASTRITRDALRADGNTEIWLYQIPQVQAVDLSSGGSAPFVNLNAGTFIRVTDTAQTAAPVAGTATTSPIIRDDNNSPTISGNGNFVAFVSNRDLTPAGSIAGQDTGNAGSDANREIYVYNCTATANNIRQITKTSPGTITQQIFNVNPAISGNGARVAFLSTAINPVRGASGGDNSDLSIEIFYANLDTATGDVTATATDRQTQITKTVRGSNFQTVNFFFNGGISLDGRFIAFESLSDDPSSNSSTIRSGYELFVYDAGTLPAGATGRYRVIGARTFDDTAASGGDLRRFPTFTDYDQTGTPNTVIFQSRINYAANGTIPATAGDGLNPNTARPIQLYSNSLAYTGSGTTTTNLVRLTRNPSYSSFITDSQPFVSNTRRRLVFSLGNTELGGLNIDLLNEAFYLLTPTAATTDTTDSFSFATGASARPFGSPSPTPSPSPSATPTTPNAVTGLSPGMLAVAKFKAATRPSATAAAPEFAGLQQLLIRVRTPARRFELPIELAGATLIFSQTATGNIPSAYAAAGLYSLNRATGEITFVVPVGLLPGTYDVAFNDNGSVTRGSVTVNAAQPDIFTRSIAAPSSVPISGGRARVFNITRRVPTIEPFNVFTFGIRPQVRQATRARIYATGIAGAVASQISISINGTVVSGASILTGSTPTEQPGVYAVDFLLPSTLAGAGDVPVVITLTGGSITYPSRLEDTAPRIVIL